jgi:hypothetical protein
MEYSLGMGMHLAVFGDVGDRRIDTIGHRDPDMTEMIDKTFEQLA